MITKFDGKFIFSTGCPLGADNIETARNAIAAFGHLIQQPAMSWAQLAVEIETTYDNAQAQAVANALKTF